MSKKISLRPLPIVDLSVKYARVMENNKIIHYQVGIAPMYYLEGKDKDPVNMIKAYIEKEEGPVEIELLPLIDYTKIKDTNTPETKDISDIILEKDLDIKKSLLQSKCESFVMQQNVKVPIVTRLYRFVLKPLNHIIHFFNKVLARMQGTTLDEVFHYEKWGSYVDIKLIPYINGSHEYVREAYSATHLSVGFEEDQVEEAVQSLLSDLRILHGHGLIKGHLFMPFMMGLSDKVGSGKRTYALSTSLFLDTTKLCKILKTTRFELSENPLHLLGVKNESYEGGIHYLDNVHPSSKYTIENISVLGTPSDEAYDAYVDSFMDSVNSVNDVANKANKALKELSFMKRESESNLYSDHKNRVSIHLEFNGSSPLVDHLNKHFSRQ